MGDSWEDEADAELEATPALNAGAREWTPNAAAKEWKPSWLPGEGESGAATEATPPPVAPVKEQLEQLDIGSRQEEQSRAPEGAVPLPSATAQEPKAVASKEPATEEKPQSGATSGEGGVSAKEKKAEGEKSGQEEVDYAEEEAAALKELPDPDPREHLNVVFIGHVDAGKSTLSGSILYSMGAVDKRTIEKYEKEAKERNRESWFLAFIMDTNEEERAKGKTVEVGRAEFETENKRYTILDAPGHKNYVPAMISGASQADVGILVISARKGEFEAGFDRLGQTREHAMLAKTLGVQKLIVVINKMDEVTVQWNKDRYDHCVKKLTPFLKRCGFRVKRDVIFLPISAFTGDNVKSAVSASTCEWATKINNNKSLLQTMDELNMAGRDSTAPLRIPVLDRYMDRGGLIVLGKVDSGNVRVGQTIQMNPNGLTCSVDAIFIGENEFQYALVGENIKLKVKGIEESDINKGFVISGVNRPARSAKKFVAQLQVLDLLEHRSLFTAGYQCVFHAHTTIEECTINV